MSSSEASRTVVRLAGMCPSLSATALTVALAAAWLLFLLSPNWNPSILFYTGRSVALPPVIDSHTVRVADAAGYDAQYYHLIAHDPWNRRGLATATDNSSLRWRRIGVPAAAWLLAFGQDRWVDWAWIAVEIASLALAAWCLGVWAPALLLLPGTLVSLDRMTVDLPLVAATVGTLKMAHTRWVYLALVLAPLIRETGILLICGFVIWRLQARDFRQAAAAVVCAIPALGWWLWVSTHTTTDGTAWLAAWPLSGLVKQTLHGIPSGTSTLAVLTENLALAGYWIAMLLPFWLVSTRRSLPELTAVCIVLFFAMLGRTDIWESAYATGRTLTPLLVMLGWVALRDGRWWLAIPILLVLPRIALQFAAEIWQRV